MLLYQPHDGYCYNSDSLFLYDFAMQFNPRGRVLDVGCGSGVVGLLIARDAAHAELTGIDVQEPFVFYAKKNAEVNAIKSRVLQCSLQEFDSEEPFDYIVSNPPFYHEGASRSLDEMRHYARYNVHLPLDVFCNKASKLLHNNGHFIFCYDAKQIQDIMSALEQAKMRAVTMRYVFPRASKHASLVMVQAKKHSKSLTAIQPPLFGFEEDEFSKEAAQIYKKARTHSIKCRI